LNLEPVLIWAISALITFSCVWAFSLVSTHLRLTDLPDYRKRHGEEVPLVGGLAIYVTLICIVFASSAAGDLVWFIISTSLIVATGAVDDAFGLGPWLRLILQVIATFIILVGAPLTITSTGMDFIDGQNIGEWFSLTFTLVAVVGLTNAFNLSDGIDGLAAGYALVCLICLILGLYFANGYVEHFGWLMSLVICILTFGMINLSLTPLKKVFLGDAGSLLIGFVVSWVLIFYSQNSSSILYPVGALWCVALPVFDTVAVIISRWKSGRSPLLSDRNHLHYLLLDSGMSSHFVLATILGWSLALGVSGLLITYLVSPFLSLGLYFGAFILFNVITANLKAAFEGELN